MYTHSIKKTTNKTKTLCVRAAQRSRFYVVAATMCAFVLMYVHYHILLSIC